MSFSLDNAKICIIGLGYVGLPLAVEFGKRFDTIGFDINTSRVSSLKLFTDTTLECTEEEIKNAEKLKFTSLLSDLNDCNIYIVTVPTPIDEHKQPDLTPLIKASEMLGNIVSKNDILIYESTVYPGATEEVCIPVVEKISNLIFNKDFFAGYSPERINPGDKERRLTNILKITSGSTSEVSDYINLLYNTVIKAGTYKASSIKVAEAAKVIENTQRDVNIALINELAIIFNKLNIDTTEVLEAAGTKWNFLPFRPGLVGGHCIGVDPYYLTHKSQALGYIPDIINAARRINDGMGEYVVSELIKLMLKKGIKVINSKVLVMGLTFKEDCPDLRNTKVVDIIKGLREFDINVDVIDPWCSDNDSLNEYGISLKSNLEDNSYDAILITVGHTEFKNMKIRDFKKLGKNNHVIYDLKSILPSYVIDARL